MSITEEEARKKWCPFARVVCDNQSDGSATGAGNRFNNLGIYLESQCIASECMAWRWVLTEKPGLHVPMGVKERVEGYCGLAGKKFV